MPCMKTIGRLVEDRCGRYQYESVLEDDCVVVQKFCGRGGITLSCQSSEDL